MHTPPAIRLYAVPLLTTAGRITTYTWARSPKRAQAIAEMSRDDVRAAMLPREVSAPVRRVEVQQ